jgi:hypothetical protein
VKDWKSMGTLDWAADGKGFFAVSPTPDGAVLLHVDFQGNALVLVKQKGDALLYGVPSANGHYLALFGYTGDNNIWMMKNF